MLGSKCLIAFATWALMCTVAPAQNWSPQRNVEIVVGSTPGSNNDKTARAIEKFLREIKLVSKRLSVVNKPGSDGDSLFNYIGQHTGDAHYLMIGTTAMLTNNIVGSSNLSYLDFTPIASLFNDYVVFAVNAQSPIKTGTDLIERLTKNPQSIVLGFATSLGSHNHVAAGLLLKAAGGNPLELKCVAFDQSSEAIAALLGGNVDFVTTSAGSVAAHVQSGRLRIVGVSADKRLSGPFAKVPTWKEQNVNLVYGSWRSIMGPRGMTTPQVAFWEKALQTATQSPEWKSRLDRNYWSDDFVTSAQFRKDLEKDYASIKAVLTEMGLAR